MGQELQPQNSAENDDQSRQNSQNSNNSGGLSGGVGSYNIWQSIGFFSGDEHLTFIFKKTEKIASAMYLVSSLLKDTEPIKWELREKGIDLLLATIAVNSGEPFDKNAIIHSFFSDSLEALSLLNVAFVSGLISEMNHAIIVHEIEAVVTLLKEKVSEGAAKAGYVLSDSFFKTDPSLLRTDPRNDFERSDTATPNVTGGVGNASNASNISTVGNRVGNTPKKDHRAKIATRTSTGRTAVEPTGTTTERIAVKDKKDGRKAAIIDLLKKKSHLTIKDFSDAIHGCSAKTIQRELLDLVAKGVVDKEGERRWSRYSLA